MKQYDIWYAINPTFRPDHHLTLDDLKNSHKYVQTIEADDLDNCYNKMQEDEWNSDFEGEDLIRCLGLNHISMGVGDVVIEAENKDTAWQCAGEEWLKINRRSELMKESKNTPGAVKITPEKKSDGAPQYPIWASIHHLTRAIEYKKMDARV